VLLISFVKTLLALLVWILSEALGIHEFLIGFFALWGYLFFAEWAETYLINRFNPEEDNG
jgi:hypothetical protein